MTVFDACMDPKVMHATPVGIACDKEILSRFMCFGSLGPTHQG